MMVYIQWWWDKHLWYPYILPVLQLVYGIYKPNYAAKMSAVNSCKNVHMVFSFLGNYLPVLIWCIVFSFFKQSVLKGQSVKLKPSED